MDSLSLHRGGWRDARVVLQALFAELAVYLNRAGGWAAQAPTTDLRTPPPTSRSPTRTKQPICRRNNIPRHFLRPTMIEFALLFTCFRKLGPGFRKPSAGPVVVRKRRTAGNGVFCLFCSGSWPVSFFSCSCSGSGAYANSQRPGGGPAAGREGRGARGGSEAEAWGGIE